VLECESLSFIGCVAERESQFLLQMLREFGNEIMR
jgi:hypothetical protein